MPRPSEIEVRLREVAPRVLGTLVRRHGQFEACEDAVQEALIAASQQWPREGVPDDPRAWLVAVANRRLVDAWRSESARRGREKTVFELDPTAPPAASDTDDTLDLLVLCCHPAVSPALAGRADPASSRGSHDGRDRQRIPGAGGDDGPAHQPGEGGHQGGGGALR